METDFYEYSLFELIATVKGLPNPIMRNLLVPSIDYQYYLDRYEKEFDCTINRAVLLADKIEATPHHDFNYGAQ